MKNKNKNTKLFLFLFLILLLAGVFGFGKNIAMAYSSDVVINEIQTSGTSADDEFIELYNLSDNDMNLSDYSIQYKGGGGTKYSKKNFPSDGKIKSHGYFLIAHNSFSGSITPDMQYSVIHLAGTVLGAGGTIYLVQSQKYLDEIDPASAIIDKVGYGVTYEYEAFPAHKPEAVQSIERKNFIDTDNNYEDFNLSASPSPQNSFWRDEDIEDVDDKDDDSDDSEVIFCDDNSDDMILNEIYPNTESSADEFVEILNDGENCADISEWTIKDDTDTSSHKYTVPDHTILASKDYFYIEKNLYLNNDDDVVYLLNKSGLEKDKRNYEKAARNKSYSFNGSNWEWTPFPTQGKENKFEEKKVYSLEIYINEVLPNPQGKDVEGEFMEFYNASEFSEDLAGWKLQDKNGKKHALEKKSNINLEINPKGYLVINPNDYGVSLHNTVDEKITLLDPNENTASKVTYKGKGVKENVSYNFDGKNWRWSNKLTPGEKNKFNNLPEVSKKKDSKIYVNVYADFSAKGYDKDKDKLKFKWDFGDGHHSYKKETRHKYEKAGKYKVTLKVSDGSEDKIETFNIEVKKYPKRSVNILSVSPNPKGKDSENEFIVIKNSSTKKVNLRGWGIATGSKKLYNHPINEDIVIKPGKTAVITRDDSKFALGNKKSKVELRYPDGKVAAKLKYDKKKENIAEDEIYTKESGQWTWMAPKAEAAVDLETKTIETTASLALEQKTFKEPEIILASSQNFSEDRNLRKDDFEKLSNQSGKVLGAYVYKSSFSGKQAIPGYLEIILTTLNYAMNYFLNYFFLKLGV